MYHIEHILISPGRDPALRPCKQFQKKCRPRDVPCVQPEEPEMPRYIDVQAPEHGVQLITLQRPEALNACAPSYWQNWLLRCRLPGTTSMSGRSDYRQCQSIRRRRRHPRDG